MFTCNYTRIARLLHRILFEAIATKASQLLKFNTIRQLSIVCTLEQKNRECNHFKNSFGILWLHLILTCSILRWQVSMCPINVAASIGQHFVITFYMEVN